ncbi:MAG: hypothetical protein NTW21_38135 [Verrucomicrobia bacterium]|nr:hypothetical protein [Verrucomicrobiota bacterium]
MKTKTTMFRAVRRLPLVGVIAVTITPTFCAAADVGQWQFNENGGGSYNDSSGYGNNLSLFNGATWSSDTPQPASGNFSGVFDGSNDFARRANDAEFQPTSAFTLSCWVKLNSLSLGDQDIMIANIGAGGISGGYQLFFAGGATPNLHMMYRNASYADQYVTKSLSSMNWQANTWYHVAGTYDDTGANAELELYVDGKLVVVETKTGNIVYNNTPYLMAGTNYDGDGWLGTYERELNGKMDQAFIHDTELTDAAIRNLATVTQTWNGGSGFGNDPTKWTIAKVPSYSSICVLPDYGAGNPYTVTVNALGGGEILDLEVRNHATVKFDGYSLIAEDGGEVLAGGTMIVKNAIYTPNSSLALDGVLELDNGIIGGAVNTSATSVIKGYGTINSALSNNNGVIRAENNQLSIDLASATHNAGTLGAAGGGILYLRNAPADNELWNKDQITLTGGTLKGSSTSMMLKNYAAGDVISGYGRIENFNVYVGAGTLTASGGLLQIDQQLYVADYTSTVNVQSGATLHVPNFAWENNNTLNLSGGTITGAMLTQDGTLSVTGTGTIQNVTFNYARTHRVENGATLKITGQGVLSNATISMGGASGAFRVDGSGALARGRGVIDPDVTVAQGSLYADSAATTLRLSRTLTVNGSQSAYATGGSGLQVDGMANNSGSLYATGAGSTLTCVAAVTNTGTLSAAAGATVALNGDVNNGNLVHANGGTVNISGTIKDGYAGEFRATTAALNVLGSIENGADNTFTANSGGTITLPGGLSTANLFASDALRPRGGTLTIPNGTTLTHGAGKTIAGWGQLLGSGRNLVNQGTVRAESGTLTAMGNITNLNSMQVGTGGTLALPSTLVNNGQIETSGSGVVQVGTTAWFGDAGSGTGTQSGGSFQTAAHLHLGLNGGNGAYTISSGTLTVESDLIVGDGSTGRLTADGGTVKVRNILFPNSGGTGTGTITVDGGTLNLTGNTIGVTDLNLGERMGRTGAHTLGVGQTLTAANLRLGMVGTGSFTQRGGTANLTRLHFGTEAGGAGTYLLRDGVLVVSDRVLDGAGTGVLQLDGGAFLPAGGVAVDHLKVGIGAPASHQQTGQAYEVGTLTLGDATYRLSGGTLAAGGVANTTGTGALNIDGGAFVPAGAVDVDQLGIGLLAPASHAQRAHFYQVGTLTLGAGSYTLSGGTLQVAGDVINSGGTGTLALDGGILSAGGAVDVDHLQLGVDASASYKMAGGTVQAGTVTFGVRPGGNGMLMLAGGSLTAGGIATGSGSGTLVLNGGTLALGGDVALTRLLVGSNATASFAQPDRRFGITSDLSVGSGTGRGTYRFDGTAELAIGNNLEIGTGGATGRFEWYRAGGLTVGGMVVVGPGGTLALGHDFDATALAGMVTGLANGTLEVTRGASGIQNTGLLAARRLQLGGADGGGTFRIQNDAQLVIGGSLNLGAVGQAGRFEWLHGAGLATPELALTPWGTLALGFDFEVARLLDGSLFGGVLIGAGAGTIEISGGATATQAGSAAKCGRMEIGGLAGVGTLRLLSDMLAAASVVVGDAGPGTMVLDPAGLLSVNQTLVFGRRATLDAAPGSRITLTGADVSIHGDDPAAMAGLGQVLLAFQPPPGQAFINHLELCGRDLGAIPDGFVDNFALHQLVVGSPEPGSFQHLRLINGIPNQGPDPEALYVHDLEVHDGAVLDLNGLNVYYDGTLVVHGSGSIINGRPQYVETRPYHLWARSFGLDPEGNGAPDQDPDLDGIVNALEYLFGASPVSGSERGSLRGVNDGTGFVLSYQCKVEAIREGFLDRVTYGTDLANAAAWPTAEPGVGGVTITRSPIDPETEQVEVRIPAAGVPVMFGRVVVTVP